MVINTLHIAYHTQSYSVASFGKLDKSTRQTIDGTIILESFCVFPIGMSFSSDDDMGLKITKTEPNG